VLVLEPDAAGLVLVTIRLEERLEVFVPAQLGKCHRKSSIRDH